MTGLPPVASQFTCFGDWAIERITPCLGTTLTTLLPLMRQAVPPSVRQMSTTPGRIRCQLVARLQNRIAEAHAVDRELVRHAVSVSDAVACVALARKPGGARSGCARGEHAQVTTPAAARPVST
jgi:hypothetical protein